MSKIVDTFIFYDELSLLDLRLRVLSPIVDYFVLVEATTTLTGKPKNLVFQDNQEKFVKYLDKIIHVVITDLPTNHSEATKWEAEWMQRNSIMKGLGQFDDSDIIMVSDVDEIPSPSAIEYYCSTGIGTTQSFEQILLYYYINCRQTRAWYGTVIADLKTFKERTPQVLRDHRGEGQSLFLPIIKDGGWHLTCFFTPKRIEHKLRIGADAILDAEHAHEHLIAERMSKLLDLLARQGEEFKLKLIDLATLNLPKEFQEWVTEHPEFVR